MLDIEALGRNAGCAIIEIGAVAFDPESGRLGEGFHVLVAPDDRFTQDPATLQWHWDHHTWPRDVVPDEDIWSIDTALVHFGAWLDGFGGNITSYWSWGSTYDFPILNTAFELTGPTAPWKYHQMLCARTVWKLAFGDTRHADRPHDALKDAIAAATDLMEAIKALKGGVKS